MKKNLTIAIRMTIATTILLGLIYPLVVTGIAQLAFPFQANGELVRRNGVVIGSKLIGQNFSESGYFESRPSAAGRGYDAANSNGSQLGPTNRQLIDTVEERVAAARNENPNTQVPVDLVTASASGLDPDITPAAAQFQIARVARARGMTQQALAALVEKYTQQRQWGFLGEPRVNVLELNLALDRIHPLREPRRSNPSDAGIAVPK
ncbi:MAG TPA: K(+)-transporting ATPase subunit C [Candidatus Acidoferrales bacterium]|nr:K(+)-transporting ATPase subunit C [Candidatus Acidoferrales bacterium]